MTDAVANVAQLAKLDSGEEAKRSKQADVLIGLAAAATLFHTPAPDCDSYAHITIGGHRETHRVRGQRFRHWLRHQYFNKTKAGVNSDALQVAVETIAAKAMFEGSECEVHCRIAEHDSVIYIDIGDATWQAIRVNERGWEIVADPPVRFQRAPSMQALPVPTKGGSIELLRPFCNVSADGFVLLVAVLLAALRPRSNYPVLVVTGEQGCGKSSLVRTVVRLTDPRAPEQRSMPRSEEDLLVAAKAQHLLAHDNVSGLPDWLSDAICRLATGGGAGKRRLYTDEEEVLFAGRRVIALNGIEDVATRPDLVDRAVMLGLEPIADSSRLDETAFDREFAGSAPAILGSLLDGVARGLRDLPTTHIINKPRMADFALWAEACTSAYWPAGTFLRAYRANVASSVELVLEASPVGEAVRTFMAERTTWEGTAGALLPLLTAIIPEQITKERGWPKQASALGGKLRRVAPALRKVGVNVAFDRGGHNRTRTVRIEAQAEPEQLRKMVSAPSASSASGEVRNTNNGHAADGAHSMRTAADSTRIALGDTAVCAKPMRNQAADSADSTDSALRTQSGNGRMTDVEAVLAELAAQESAVEEGR